MCCQQDKASYQIWNVVYLIRSEKEKVFYQSSKKMLYSNKNWWGIKNLPCAHHRWVMYPYSYIS